MPYFGLSIHVLIALFFAVHAMRSKQEMYWLIILFSFPGLGSLVYFLAIYLPSSRLERSTLQVARKAVSAAVNIIDPERLLREARADYEATPTAQNQVRLAEALLAAGSAEEAMQNYVACLHGPFAADADLRLGAARAFIVCQRYNDALQHLEMVRKDKPKFRLEEVSLALACAYAGAGLADQAKAEFAAAYEQFGGFDVCAEYAIWAVSVGDMNTANALNVEIEKIMARWPAHAKKLNAATLKRLKSAFAQAPVLA